MTNRPILDRSGPARSTIAAPSPGRGSCSVPVPAAPRGSDRATACVQGDDDQLRRDCLGALDDYIETVRAALRQLVSTDIPGCTVIPAGETGKGMLAT